MTGQNAPIARRIWRSPLRLAEVVCTRLPRFRFIAETADSATPISFGMWFDQEVRGINRGPYWPVHRSSRVTRWRNVLCGAEVAPGYMPGCYIQALSPIRIGDYTRIGPNVCLISENHVPTDLAQHEPGGITIGRGCWIGAGAVVLPGVALGDFTTVGAGAIVTKNVPDGHAVIAGNPARIIRRLDPADCRIRPATHIYHGYIPQAEFAAFRAAELNL
ncbi:MAG: hypothetical protein GKR99_15495 [Rhodobacteraceae bacterium]|nr:hypothetical protein [Paracoccaceae bacterium]